jgi:hypothetical protein
MFYRFYKIVEVNNISDGGDIVDNNRKNNDLGNAKSSYEDVRDSQDNDLRDIRSSQDNDKKF